MSKITFRADDDLVRRLEAFDASKSEVMREALRAYLEGAERVDADAETTDDREEVLDADLDDALARRVDELVADRLAGRNDPRGAQPSTVVGDRGRSATADPTDVNVNVTIEGTSVTETGVNGEEIAESDETSERKTPDREERERENRSCGQCGEGVTDDHVYCPNCGEKTSHRVFCDCGDELRSDWAFCPGCGRRTPAADVLDRT